MELEPATLRRVADLAGVSEITVSRAFSGSAPVAEKTRKRVMDIARTVGYRPNLIAQALRTRRTHTIGMVIHYEGEVAPQLRAIERVTSDAQYDLLVGISRWDTSQEGSQLQRLLARQVDGILMLSPVNEGPLDETLQGLVQSDFPLVCIGPTPVEGVDVIDSDRTGAYRTLAEHLLKQRCRKLAFLTRLLTPAQTKRLQGVREAVAAVEGASVTVIGARDELRATTSEQMAEVIRAALTQDPPQGILAGNDELAAVTMRVAHELGIRVPTDLAVTGCAENLLSAQLDPPLTTVRGSWEEMAGLAVRRLIDRIERPQQCVERIQTLVPLEIVWRESSRFNGG